MEAQPLYQRTFQGAQGEDLPFDRGTSGVVDKGRIAVEEFGFHAVARHVDEADLLRLGGQRHRASARRRPLPPSDLYQLPVAVFVEIRITKRGDR